MSANTDIIRGIYEAVAQGDVPTVLEALDSNCQWTEAEGFPYAGTYTGPDEILNGVLARLGSEWDGFQVKPHEFIDGGEHVVALGRYAGAYKATGKDFDAAFAHVWTLEGGKVVRFHQYVDSALVQEALQH
ncbi:MAG: nuclear transport factor 2 family protein [Chloroflexota bacterium]